MLRGKQEHGILNPNKTVIFCDFWAEPSAGRQTTVRFGGKQCFRGEPMNEFTKNMAGQIPAAQMQILPSPIPPELAPAGFFPLGRKQFLPKFVPYIDIWAKKVYKDIYTK